MTRRTVLGDTANDEISDIQENYHGQSSDKALDFLSEVRVAMRAVQEQPLSRAIYQRSGDMDIRRIKVGRFPFWLSYFVYPSVDVNTGEAVDVVGVLACVHEKQAEPNWSACDPFRLP